MTQRLCACLLLVCAASAAPAATLDDARRLWLRGNYEEAQAEYEALAKVAKLRSPAVVGLSRTLQSQGEYDKALAVVAAALKALPKDADLLARRAEVLYDTGRWAEAEKTADAAVAANPKHFAARWVLLQVYRDRGDLKKADTAARWFVRAYNADEAKTAEQLLFAGLATCEYARWHHLTDEFDEVLNGVFKDALKKEPAFWPVEYHAGLLLLEKYNRGQALVALDKARQIKPRSA